MRIPSGQERQSPGVRQPRYLMTLYLPNDPGCPLTQKDQARTTMRIAYDIGPAQAIGFDAVTGCFPAEAG
jgi:hypothetical protein